MPKTAAVGGIEGGANSRAFPDSIPAPFKPKTRGCKPRRKLVDVWYLPRASCGHANLKPFRRE
jgi:hypothetical protein